MSAPEDATERATRTVSVEMGVDLSWEVKLKPDKTGLDIHDADGIVQLKDYSGRAGVYLIQSTVDKHPGPWYVGESNDLNARLGHYMRKANTKRKQRKALAKKVKKGKATYRHGDRIGGLIRWGATKNRRCYIKIMTEAKLRVVGGWSEGTEGPDGEWIDLADSPIPLRNGAIRRLMEAALIVNHEDHSKHGDEIKLNRFPAAKMVKTSPDDDLEGDLFNGEQPDEVDDTALIKESSKELGAE